MAEVFAFALVFKGFEVWAGCRSGLDEGPMGDGPAGEPKASEAVCSLGTPTNGVAPNDVDPPSNGETALGVAGGGYENQTCRV